MANYDSTFGFYSLIGSYYGSTISQIIFKGLDKPISATID